MTADADLKPENLLAEEYQDSERYVVQKGLYEDYEPNEEAVEKTFTFSTNRMAYYNAAYDHLRVKADPYYQAYLERRSKA